MWLTGQPGCLQTTPAISKLAQYVLPKQLIDSMMPGATCAVVERSSAEADGNRPAVVLGSMMPGATCAVVERSSAEADGNRPVVVLNSMMQGTILVAVELSDEGVLGRKSSGT